MSQNTANYVAALSDDQWKQIRKAVQDELACVGNYRNKGLKHPVLAEGFENFFKGVKTRLAAQPPGLTDESLAALTALCVLGSNDPMPPPPQAWLQEIVWRIEFTVARARGDPEKPAPKALWADPPLRAPEFVIYELVMGNRASLAMTGPVWDKVAKQAAWVIRSYIEDVVLFTFIWLTHLVPGFPHDQPLQLWTADIYNQFTGTRRRCVCWYLGAGIEDKSLSGDEAFMRLRVNQHEAKAYNCRHVAHHLSLWWPEKWLLWHHIQRAVKGVAGRPRAKSLPSSMLMGDFARRAHEEANDPEGWPPIALVELALRKCPEGHTTMYLDCHASKACQQAGEIDANVPVFTQKRLIVDRPIKRKPRVAGESEEGGPLWDQWSEADDAPGRHRDYDDEDDDDNDDDCGARRVEEERESWYRQEEAWYCRGCGHVYAASLCRDECGCTGQHDACPLCGTEHAGSRPTRVYFHEASPQAIRLEPMHRGLTSAREDLDRVRLGDNLPARYPPQMHEALERLRMGGNFRGRYPRVIVAYLRGLLVAGDPALMRLIYGRHDQNDWNNLGQALGNLEDLPDPQRLREICREIIFPMVLYSRPPYLEE